MFSIRDFLCCTI